MSKQYHVYYREQQYGPMSWEEAKRNFPPDAQIWTDGMANWQSMSSLMYKNPTPRPMPSPVNPPFVANESSADERFASFGIRLAAYLIDLIIVWVVQFILTWMISTAMAGMFHSIGGYLVIVYLVSIIIAWLYFAILESSEYQATIGKMVLKVRVVDRHFNRISFGNASGRFFGKLLSGLILGIGYLMVLWTPQRQALHDQIADTYIIKNDQHAF
jgi:uncharacterized RDD family membrane protein YckC